MSLGLDVSGIRNLAVPSTVSILFAILGMKRGWKGQLVSAGLMVLVWAAFTTGGNALLELANKMYRGLLFLAFCGTREEPSACPRAAEFARAALVDPANSDQRRLFFVIGIALTSVVAYLIIVRFGMAPQTLLHKLAGAVAGLLNGFLLSYLLLPLALQPRELLPASAAQIPQADSLQVPQPVSGFTATSQAGVSLVFVILFVLFVIVAVRLMRPIKPESDGHSQA